MRIGATIIMLMILAKSYGQAPIGIGIIEIGFDDKTVIDFFKKPTDSTRYKKIEFFNDKKINGWNIENLEEHQQTWLMPEVLWLDYNEFKFRCKSTTRGWFEVIVNNENGESLWIKKTKSIKFTTWEGYLKNMFSVERIFSLKQKIRKSPSESADEIKYEGYDCFKVRSLDGDWIEIFSPDYCKTKIKSGWIRWRKGNELLINYFPTS